MAVSYTHLVQTEGLPRDRRARRRGLHNVAGRDVYKRQIDTLRQVFELNGFIGIETRAVETGASLLKKGETSKEIYLLSRLQEVGHESDTPIDERLGLNFDLTVPLSRYVVEHSGALAFPFKRWQIQKVWRGERPQEGRFREFVQALSLIHISSVPNAAHNQE